MRFAMLLAAVAALWVQPAKATSVFFSGSGYGTLLQFSTSGDPISTIDLWAVQGSLGDAYLNADGVTYSVAGKSLAGCPLYICALTVGPSGFSVMADNSGGLGPTASLSLSGTLSRFDVVSGPPSAQISFSVRALPEPATWALMLVGFGLMGWALRHHGAANVHLNFTPPLLRQVKAPSPQRPVKPFSSCIMARR